MSFPRTATNGFRELIHRQHYLTVEFPHLKAVAGAQWALESGWGSSPLARRYYNYAGMKWRPGMEEYGAEPVSYQAHDGRATYARFHSYADFINAYWGRLDDISAYSGWREHAATPKDFMLFIGPIWVGGSPAHGREYVRKVLQLHDERLARIYRSLAED